MYEIFNFEQYPEIIPIAAAILMLLIFLPAVFPRLRGFIGRLLETILKKPDIKDKSLQELIDSLGYAYDKRQDIFYSKINAWQRDMGYCRLYDEAAAPMSMIIDCEPIYFEYNNKRWLIEFWKGQYGMTTGCEIGVYSTEDPDIQTEYFNGTFYECAGDNDLLSLSFELIKNGKRLFKRSDVHWWLTGFMLGEFSDPSELIVFAKIKLKDSLMRDEFVKGLKNAGYEDEEIVIINDTVRLVFDKPKSEQPYTRNELTDYIMQSNNRELINQFNEMTKGQESSIDKIIYLKDTAPELFDELFHMLGRKEDVFNAFWYLQNNL